MTSVEKRRSGRKSGGHRKHSDGGYSDTSSSGSFLDETDREVSNLTDRAFRSLCIGDEAVYNDSDLCPSSPCSQRDKQLAFGQSGQNREDREREELKRAAHESFSRLRAQQYEQDWVHGGISGAEIYRDPQWEIHGEMTQGRVSATFQHSFVETAQQEQTLREDHLSFLSNGATEFSSQQRRSRSRVSSLIRTFNSDSQKDGAWTNGKLRERYNDNSWDKNALMSIQRELSEFSNSYQQNFNSDNFPTADPFSSRDGNLYSSQVAAVARVNSAPSFMSASHGMSTQFNCNSNFFIHSEFSPFKVWRDHNRFPFQQEQVSGFAHHSEIPKWYETPMYKELSQEAQPQGSYRFKERDYGHSRNNFLPVVPPSPPRSTSTSTVLQKALAVEKRCESELMGHYTHRKRTQSLGTNRLPTQRPSTASPTTEISRRVQETISSVKALQQKIKNMSEQNMATGVTANQQGVVCSDSDFISFGQNAATWAPHVVRSNTAPLNISQLLTPSGHTHQEASVVQPCEASPEPVEHAPVRAESRGATPDIRMSGYRSRARSLLFNLKDNRKRVKNTYSPTRFKNVEMMEKNKPSSVQEPRDTVIDIPDFPDPDIQFTHAAAHQHLKQYQNPGLSFEAQNPCPKTAHAGQYSAYSLSDYQTAEKQNEMVCHSRFPGFTPENYTATQLANGQNPHEDSLPLSSYQYAMTDNVESLRGGVYGLNTSYRATDTPKHTVNNQTSNYFRGNANAEQYFNETVEREFTKVERYQQPKDNQHDYSNVFSQDRWRNEQDTEKLISPWKQEINALIQRDQHEQAYQRAAIIKEENNLTREKYREQNLNPNKQVDKLDLEQSFVMGTSHKSSGVNNNISNQQPQCPPIISNDAIENKTYYGQQQPGTIRDKYVLQKYDGNNVKKETKDNSLTQSQNRHTNQDYRNQHALYSKKVQETGQRKQYTPVPEGHKMQCLQQIQATPHFEYNVQKNPLSGLENAAPPTTATQVKDRQFAEVKAAQATTEHIKAQHTQAELAKAQHRAQVEQPKAESAWLILAGQTGSEEVKAEQPRAECEKVKKREAEPVKDITSGEQSKEKPLEHARKEETKVKTQKPRDITEEVEASHMKKEQGEHVNTQQAEVDKLKEEYTKPALDETERVIIQTAHAKREITNVQKVEENQVIVEQMDVENTKQIRAENTEAKQVEKEQRKDDKAKHEQIKEQQSKTQQLKMKEDEVGKVKADQIKIEDVRVKPKEDSNQAGHINSEQPTTQLSPTKEAKSEEQTNMERAKPELPKTEDLHEKLVKPRSNITVKNEPDKVERVKTELAKAKAELAKIKEKMRGEQKDKVKNITITGDIAKKDDTLKVNVNKNEDFEKKDQVTQMDKKKRDSLVTTYDNLREKEDLTNAFSTNSKNNSARDDSSNDDNKTPTLSLVGAETVNNNKSNDKHSPKSGFAIPNNRTTENREEVISLKCNDVTEGHYVYSESSKEFKLFSSSYSPRNADNKDNFDTVTDKEKNSNVEKLEKAMKHTDISQQRHSDLRKHDPHERKHRSTDHGSLSGKDLHFTPPRALTQKERAQTKQEILTSKIKAHAEKEISAIKEKGLRDGFISKNSTKQFAGSQSINIRQRPPKHESTVSETVKSVSSSSSATTPVMSAANTGQLVDSSQKQVPKEPVKSNDNAPVSTRSAKQMGSSTTHLAENQENQKNQPGVKSPVQSKEKTIKDNQAKQESGHEANSGKQKDERLKDNSTASGDRVNEKKNYSSEATDLVKVTTTEKADVKHEAVAEESAPTLNLVLQDQNTNTMADDSLQIMGIMVTVRERTSLEKNGEWDNSTQECVHSKTKEGNNLDRCHHSSGQVSKERESSTEGSRAKTNNRVVKEMYPTEKEDQTKINPEIPPETFSEQMAYASVSVTDKNTNLQEGSSVNTRYQRETQLQRPMTEKAVAAIVTAPAKNKVLAETESHLYKQGIVEGVMNDTLNKVPKENSTKNTTVGAEEKTNPQKTQTAHTHDKVMAQVDNKGTHLKMESGRTDEDSSIKYDVSMSKDMATFINPSKCGNTDGKSALMDEKRHDSTQLRSSSEARPPHSLNENHNRCVTPKLQFKEKFTGKNNQVDDVHIDSIAIRVVPSVTKKDIAGNHCLTAVPLDVDKSTELKGVASPRREEKANTSNNDNRVKDGIPANSDRQVEDKLGVQHVLASVRKLSDSLKQHKNVNGTQTGKKQPETVKEREESVDEAKIKAMEGDYFQVQGAAETNDELHNSAKNGETLDGVSKGGGLPGSNKTPVSNKPYKELQYEAFVLDPIIKKTLESSQVKVQDENMEKKNLETEGKPASKQTDTPTERQNSSEKNEKGKHHTVSQSSLSARESHSSRNSDQTRDNTVSEKAGVKPKLKSSTIPEISAIADYARLKVIVSEEQESTMQEFPPNKKEGFFPLIQTRHSRRPVFTLDPKEFPMKEKKIPNKTEMSAKVNKEPKALVFPITEKEHQRTGMFKLGDKERQEKMFSDNQGILDTDAKYTQCPKERMKSPTAVFKNQGCEDQVAGTDNQRPTNTSASQHIKSPVNFKAHEKQKQCKDDSRTVNKGETFEDKLVKRREEGKEKPNQEGHEETTAKQSQKEQESIIEEEKRAEEIRKKRIIEESRASLAEEERKAAQREEERRAKEREAIALRIKERREKQRESDKMKENRAAPKEEEMRANLREEESKMKETERTKTEEDRRAKLRREEEQIRENEERRRLKQQEEERASREKEQQRAAQEEQLRRAVQEEQQRGAALEKQKIATHEEQQRRAAQEEQQRRAAQGEQQRRAVQGEQQRRAAQEEQQRRAAQGEQQRRAAQGEQQRRAAQGEQQRRAAQEEQQRRAAQGEQQSRAAQGEQQSRAAQGEQQSRAAQGEQQSRAAQGEQQRRAAQEEQQRRAAQEERQRRAVQEEQQRRAVQEEQQRRAVQEEQQKGAALEKQKIATHKEQQRRAAQEEQQRRAAQEEQQRRAAQEEQQRRAAQEEQQRRAAQEEQQRRAAQEEQQRQATQEEQQRRAIKEEHQQRAAQEEQQRRAAQEEQQRRAAQEEQQRRAAQEEQQSRAAQEEQQSRAAQEEQQSRAAQEEQQRRAAHEEQKIRALQEEQQRRAELEKQKIAAFEEQQRRAAQKEQQHQAAQEEQRRRAAEEEQGRRAEQQKIAALEKQKIATQEQQQSRAVREELQIRTAQEQQQRFAIEQQKIAAQHELQRRAVQEMQQIRSVQEEQQRRATLDEQQTKVALIEEQKQIKQTRERIQAEIGNEKKIIQEGKEDRDTVEKEKTVAKQKIEKQTKEERTIELEDIKAGGESQPVREWITQKEEEIKAKMSEEDEQFAPQRQTERATQTEEQRRAAQMMDALQYYAITSSESERKTKDRQVCSPFPSQQKHNPPERESTEDSGTYTRHYRPHGSVSPAPRSNTSSPALGVKPSMFRVKDNTIRGSSLTKPVKPRFHKNFGEDFHVASPIERASERGEEEQEITRHGADTRINRLAAIKEFSSSQPESSSQDYSSCQPQHRPYSRRSIALDEDDSRSVISNISEGVESFATSATDLADVRGLYDYERPESACSYSSDMSRSMGKPPAVPPKSDKAMQRAKRLTTRRVKKELSKAEEEKHARVEKPPQEVSRNPPSSSNEVYYSNRRAVASPHFSLPISLAHAPVGMPTSHTEHPSFHHSVQVSPHATGASSLPITSPHVTASVASSNPTSHASNNAVLKTVPHVSSSPTLHHATHPAPVTQYHVESSYPQPYPFTQRKVLQDLGSGQYFVVDVPVQVKTKTFFDPETGKYVQLNVRESGQSTSRPQSQLQSQIQVKSQPPQASPAGKPIVLYQGYHGYPQGYQPTAINSIPPNGSSTPLSLHQNQQPARENNRYGYPTCEVRENSEGYCYSPEKTPYMDTVNDTEKTYNTIYNTHGSYEAFPECDTNSQLAGSSVCENDNSAHTRYQPRDIIAMGELEDFMEVSDW